MSYILEALKKSEQERGNTSSPSIQTIHSSSLQYAQQKKPLWPYVMAAVFTLNIVALIYFLSPAGVTTTVIQDAARSPATDAVVQQLPVASSTITPKTMTQIAYAQPAIQQQSGYFIETQPDETVLQKAPAFVVPAPKPANTYNSNKSVVDILELPLDIQTSIPDMTFTAHVYSSNPQQRSVVINGNFMEEGDMLTASLQLDEITLDGVVFDYQGTRFRSSILSDWRVN